MTQTSVTSLENALHTTNIWLKELMEELGWEDRQRSYLALRVVLHALRDRLTVAEVADLGAQLPMLIRGLYYEGWQPADKTAKARKKDEFLFPVAEAFRDEPEVYAEDVARAVFRLLQTHVSAGEVADVKGIVQAEVRSLWPGEGVGRGS